VTAPQEVLSQGDPRIDVFSNAVIQYDRREDFVREIGALWQRAQETFLTIGRYLAMAKARLPHGEYTAMIERELPFGPGAALQIRGAAQAVDSGRLPADRLPPNYSTIYTLSTLPDDALERARQEGLIRPTLKRAEVVAFKRRVLTVLADPEPGEARARRLAELRRQREALDAEIARLEAERSE